MALRIGSSAELARLYAGSAEVQRVYRGTNLVWQQTGQPVDPVTSGDVTFGALTRAGEGGYPVPGATTISNGNVSGHWQISAGRLTPSATGEGSISGTYSLTLNNGASIGLTVEADAATIAPAGANGCDELTRYIDEDAVGAVDWSAGGTIYLRPGTYDTFAEYNTSAPGDMRMMSGFHLAMGPTTIRSADADNKAHITGWVFNGNATASDIILQDLRITCEQNTVSMDPFGLASGNASQRAVNFIKAQDCAVIDCEIEGDLIHFDEGGRSYDNMAGISVEEPCSNITIRGNKVQNVHLGIGVQGTDCIVEDNEVSDVHGDFYNFQATADRLMVRGNRSHDYVGDPTYRHGDWMQINVAGGKRIEDLVIENNIHWSGGKGRVNARQGDSLPGVETFRWTNDPALVSVNDNYILIGNSVTLGDAEIGRILIVSPAAGTTIDVNMPSAAASEGKQWTLRRYSEASDTGQVRVNLNGSDTHEDGNPILTDNNDQFIARSDGTSVWKYLEFGRLYYEFMVYDDITLQPWHDHGGVVVNTSQGNVTVTLPAGSTDARFKVRRVYPATNTFTLQTTGGDIMAFENGVNTTSAEIEIGDSYTIEWNGTSWAMGRRSATNMGIFANDGAIRGVIRNNVGLLRSTSGIRIADGDGVEDGILANNLVMYQPDATDFAPAGCNIQVEGTNCIGFGNIASGNVIPGAGGLEKNNRSLDVATWQDLYDFFGGSTIEDLIPGSFEEAVAIARPVMGEAAYAAFVGPLGLTDSEGAMNPSTQTANAANYPDPVVDTVSPAIASTIGETTSIEITFSDFVEFGTGNITIYNETDGVAVEVFDVTTSPQVVIAGTVLTVIPSSAMPGGKEVSIRIASTAIVSRTYDTTYAGVADNTYRFNVSATALSAWPLVTADGSTHLRKSPYGGPVGDRNTLVVALIHVPNITGSERANILYRDDSKLDVYYRAERGEFYAKIDGSSLKWTGVTITNGTPTTILLTMDTGAADAVAGSKLFINGVEQTSVTGSWVQGAGVSLDDTDLLLFENEDAAPRTMRADLGMLFMDRPATIPDISQVSERAKFEPAALDADPTDPTGQTPEVLMYGDAASWNAGTNQGTGGDFTTTGIFTDVSLTTPS